uniref:TOG domain-containing protein n=1 Tax=Clytia hemisphaerica TaxID=252671 RepID=A0A7M5WKK3_9CNID
MKPPRIAIMLYYLDMVPVPANIQAYIQTGNSPNLSYSASHDSSHKGAPKERCSSATFTREHKYQTRSPDHKDKYNTPNTEVKSRRSKTISHLKTKIPKILKSKHKSESWEHDGNNNNNFESYYDDFGSRDCKTFQNNHSRYSSLDSETSSNFSELSFDYSSSLNSSMNSSHYLSPRSDTNNHTTSTAKQERRCRSAISFTSRLHPDTRPSETTERPTIRREKSGIPVANKYRSKSLERRPHKTVERERPKSTIEHQRSRSPGIPIRTNGNRGRRPRNHSDLNDDVFVSSSCPKTSYGRMSRLHDSNTFRVTNSNECFERTTSSSSPSTRNCYSANGYTSKRPHSSCSGSSGGFNRSFEKETHTQDFHEILHMLQQDASNTKRDGLTSFQGLLQSSMRYLNTEEAVRVKETFNRYFAEPNSKIYSSFLDVLSEFLVQYKNDLQDWLFILLTRLLQRLSTDILQSSQTKIARVLDVVRDSYPYDHQFQIITKYITDKTQTPSLNMKLSLLQYTRGLIALMDANDFTNSAVTRLAITRVITWMSEPKSADVRKESANVIVALFQLNPSEFSMVLSSLPNSIQEGATRAINIEIKNPNGTGSVSTPPYASTNHMRAQSQTVPSKQEHMEKPIYRTASPAKHASRIQMRDEYATGSPVTRTPLSTNSRQDTYGESASTHERLPIANKLSYSSPQESAVPNHVKATPETPYAYNTHYNSENSPMWLSTTKDMSQYNPKSYEDSLIESTRNLSFTSPVNRIADGAEQPDETDDGLNSSMNLLNEISTILSQHHRGIDSEDIKSALIELLKTMRSATNNPMLGQKLQGLLPSVMVMLKHSEATVRCLAIRCLREICQSHPNIYRSDLQSFLMPLLETESDNTKEVSKTAEECCNLISQTIPADELLPIIAPVCGSSNFPTNSSAIKMLNMVSDSCESSVMKKHIETVVPNLLKAYDHTESMVRKAACFCLVSVHNVAGPDLVQPYFQNLAGSKIKLLNLYIRRSQTSNV